MAEASIYERPLDYPIPEEPAIHVRTGLVYANPDGQDLLMDFYTPEQPSGPARPVVLFIHGGPILPQKHPPPKTWEVFRSYGRLVTGLGFAGVTFNYRYTGLPDLEASLSDIRSALDYLHRNCEQFNLDPERTFLWFFSGSGLLLQPLLTGVHDQVRGVLLYYPILNLPTNEKEAHDLSPDYVRRFSSETTFDPEFFRHVPIFIAAPGTEDAGYKHAIAHLVHAALDADLTLELVTYPHGHHGFDLVDPGEYTRYIISRSLAFLEKHRNK